MERCFGERVLEPEVKFVAIIFFSRDSGGVYQEAFFFLFFFFPVLFSSARKLRMETVELPPNVRSAGHGVVQAVG